MIRHTGGTLHKASGNELPFQKGAKPPSIIKLLKFTTLLFVVVGRFGCSEVGCERL